MKKWDVVIIGSGISSLTCAALLAKKGKSVCVLEQHTKPGGYLHCFSRFRQRFDTGAHYVGAMDPGQPFHTLLNYLGVYRDDLFLPLDEDGFDVFRYPDFEVEIPKGYERLIETLSARFPKERAAITAFFRLIRDVSRSFPTYEFNEKASMENALRYLDISLSEIVDGLTGDASLRAVLFTYCVLHGVNPRDVSFGLHSILVDSLIRGPHGFAQGGDALAESYVGRIRAAGGQVLVRKKVKSIETKDKAVRAVVTHDGERFESEWVISGIHPKATFSLVDTPSAFTPAFRNRLGRIKETPGIFGLYAKCRENSGFNPRRNYYFIGGLEPDGLMRAQSPSEKPHTVFISPAQRLDPEPKSLNIHAVAPIEWFSEWTETNYGKRPGPYNDVKGRYAGHVLNFVDEFEPGFKARLENFSTSTPVTNLHFNGSAEGSPYGIYHSIENTGARALGPATHVSNLLITGQSSLFPGLLGAAVSAIRTSGYIIGIKPILKELRETGPTA